MSREWKPGDVAVVTQRESRFFGERVMRCVNNSEREPDRHGWSVQSTDGTTMAFGDKSLRPLVVIDPEDREQVERFTRLLPEDWCLLTNEDAKGSLTAVATALREFASPTPKPCRASVTVHINTNHIAASCAEPVGHEGSHRSDNGTCWDASEASP